MGVSIQRSAAGSVGHGVEDVIDAEAECQARILLGYSGASAHSQASGGLSMRSCISRSNCAQRLGRKAYCAVDSPQGHFDMLRRAVARKYFQQSRDGNGAVATRAATRTPHTLPAP